MTDLPAPARPVPLLLIQVSLAGTVLLVLGVGFQIWTAWPLSVGILQQDYRLAQVCGELARLDETMTFSARLAASTGDPRWEAEYRAAKPRWNALLNELRILAPEAYSGHVDDPVRKASGREEYLEDLALKSVREGDLAAAVARLKEGEYPLLRASQIRGLQGVSAALYVRKEAHVERLQRPLFMALLVMLVLFPLLAVLLFRVYRTFRRFAEEHEAAVAEATKRASDLDLRLRERGAELFRTGAELRKTSLDRFRLEEQLRESQKMEVVGRLAGGVVHDFNNFMTVIRGYADLTLPRLPPDDPLHTQLADMRDTAERALAITRRLIAFTHHHTMQLKSLDLGEVVEGLQEMLRQLLGDEIRLVIDGDRPLGRIHADRSLLENAILQFVVRARESMPKGGTLTIETRNLEIQRTLPNRKFILRASPCVVLAITDTGVGMDLETQSRLFEPFFKAHEGAEGSGLGLAIAHGIVKQFEGYVTVHSETGHGTNCRLYFPRAAPAEPSTESSLRFPSGGNETILLVEDEAGVREMVREALESLGYTVLAARRGPEALALALRQTSTIHLVVTDVAMPEMSGRELVERLSPSRPGVRVLYITGHPEEILRRYGVSGPGVPLLHKPFTVDELGFKVREILDPGALSVDTAPVPA